MRNILYGEFITNFNIKRFLVALLLLIALLNYFDFGFLNFISFENLLFGKVKLGTVWMLLTIWVLIWFTNKKRGM